MTGFFLLDEREKTDKRDPIALEMPEGTLLYWPKKAIGVDGARALRMGWYAPERYTPEPQQRELYLAGIKLRGAWKKTAKPVTDRKELPEHWRMATFVAAGMTFRYANFPDGEDSLREAVSEFLEAKNKDVVCKRYGLKKPDVLYRAAKAMGAGDEANARLVAAGFDGVRAEDEPRIDNAEAV